MRPARFVFAIALPIALFVPALASAQAPSCPGTKIERAKGRLGEQGTATIPIDLAPCQTLELNFTTTSTETVWGAYFRVNVYNKADPRQEIWMENWNMRGTATRTMPSAAPWVPPYRGTRADTGLVKEVTLFADPTDPTSFVDYEVIIKKIARPGYNIGGTGLADAPTVQLPASLQGSLLPWSGFRVLEPGQFFRVRLNSQQGFYVSGYVLGHPSNGPQYDIFVLNTAGQALKQLHSGTAYGGPHRFQSASTFMNTTAQPADYIVRIRSRFWPLHDWGLNIVPVALTTEITEVGFRMDHLITRWSDKFRIDDPDGSSPTWVRGRGDNDKYPAAYTQTMKPTVFGTISINPPLTQAKTVSVRVKRGETVLGRRDGLSFNGATGMIPPFSFEADLETSQGVKAVDYDFDWEITYDNGANWLPVGRSGPHKVYWTYWQPLELPFSHTFAGEVPEEINLLYDQALNWATQGANGAAEPIPIAEGITTLLKNELTYNPFSRIGGHPLRVVEAGEGQCDDFAHLMRGLLRSVGVSTVVNYLWGGTAGSPNWYRYLGKATFRATNPQEDKAEAQPHFTFHAVVVDPVNGPKTYDPSYGRSGANVAEVAEFDETYDGTNFRMGSAAMTLQAISLSMTPWVNSLPPFVPALRRCDHGERFHFASFVDHSIPETMNAGQTYTVTVTFRNTGTNAWALGDGFVLTADAPDTSAEWNVSPVSLPHAVGVDQEVVFTVNLTAPLSIGIHPLQFRLKRYGESFGATSVTVSVAVQ